jgi:hypothetical protein
MSKDTKLVHVAIVDGNPEQIAALRNRLGEIKKKLPFDVEFLITNDKVQLRDVKYLIDELYILYKNYKATSENDAKGKK